MFIQSVLKAAVIGVQDENRISELVAEIVLNLTRIRHNGLIVLSPYVGASVEVVFDLQKYDDEGRALLEVSVADYRVHEASYGITDDTARKTPLGAKYYPQQEWFGLSGSFDSGHRVTQVPQGFSVTQFLYIVKNRLAAELFPGNRIVGISLIHPKVEDEKKGPWVLSLVPGVEANPWKTLLRIDGIANEIVFNWERCRVRSGSRGFEPTICVTEGPVDIEFSFPTQPSRVLSVPSVLVSIQMVQRGYAREDHLTGLSDLRNVLRSWYTVSGSEAVLSGTELPYGMSSLQFVQLIFDRVISTLVPSRRIHCGEILNSDGEASGKDVSREMIPTGESKPLWIIRLYPVSQ